MEIASVLFKTGDLVFKFLGSPIVKEIQSIRKYETEIKMLADTVDFIGDVLSDVQAKQFEQESVKKGYKRLREAFLDAEDFLDRVETLQKKREGDDRKFKKTRRFFSKSNPAKYAVEVHNAIKEIRKNLDAIVQDLQKFGLKEPSIRSEANLRTARATGSYVDATVIIGRDEDEKKIVDLLLRSSVDQKKIPVISIVGIGGMGKTTLAQLVYDDKSWQESCKFELKLWVSDSKKFSCLKSLLKNILKSISPSDASLDNFEEDHLRDRLVQGIRAKTFLIVLDDVENEDPWIWEKLEELLNCGNKEKSRVLITTRSRKVADVVGSSNTSYQLKGLSETGSLQLFERYAFRGRIDENLVEIGKHVVQKCGGVPLAIKVIGSLLCGEDKRKWKHVQDNGLAKIKEESNQLMPILKISYDDLDSTLKQCFSFCALIRKKDYISKETLRNIWMYNVRFKTNDGRSREDVCDENLKILYNRCFLEEVEIKYGSDATYLKMHDLMHDLAKDVAGEEMLVVGSNVNVDLDKLILEENVRHLNLGYGQYGLVNADGTSTFECKGRRLRTLVQQSQPWQMIFNVDKLVSVCPVLRLLDIQAWRIKNVTDSIGKLIHLRYLDLSSNEFQTLPDSITELINLAHLKLEYCRALTCLPSRMSALISLQVLDISECDKLEELPTCVEKLVNLRNLKLAGCRSLSRMPSGMGALTSLQVLDISRCVKLEELPIGIEKLINLRHLEWKGCRALTRMPSGMGALMSVCSPAKFIVGHPESQHTAQLEELGPVLELGKYLIVEFPNNITLKASSGDDGAFLLNTKGLRKLKIKWRAINPEEEDPRNHMEILAKLQPPPNLQELKLYRYEGMTFPPWAPKDDFASVLPNLVSLHISECWKCRHLPPLSRLPCLKSLKLRWLCSLEYIEEENVSSASICPSLEDLSLDVLPRLNGWCRGLATGADDEDQSTLMLPSLIFPRLISLHISCCPSLSGAALLSFAKVFDLKNHVEKDLSSTTEETLSSSTPTFSSYFLFAEICRGTFRLFMEVENDEHSWSLHISDFNATESPSIYMDLGLRGLSYHLTHLLIERCSGLKTLPGLRHLTALRSLWIGKCCDFTWGVGDEEDTQSIEHLPVDAQCSASTSLEATCHDVEMSWLRSLKWLTLIDLPKMVTLPEGIQFVTSLQELHILRCNNLLIPEWVHDQYNKSDWQGEHVWEKKKKELMVAPHK